MEAQENRDTAANKQPCVLVVDDSSVVRYTVASIIKSMGYAVVEASDGKEVLTMVDEHQPDLVILDIHMPEKGGIETLAELRAHSRYARLPVIVLTASAEPAIVRQVARLRASGYLVKSNLNAREMRERIAKILGKPTPSSTPSARPQRALQELRVLLVDDSTLDQQLIGGLLSNWGCRVETAGSGQEALDLLKGAEFDLMLIDYSMPEMDGFETTARIRATEVESGKHLPVVLLTSKPIEAVKERSEEVGMDAYVAKPVEADQLFTTIEGLAALVTSAEQGEESNELFDREELLERVDNDMELLRHLFELFTRDYPTLLDEMQQAVDAGQAEDLQRAAHTLKGMLGNLSAHDIAKRALALENMGGEETLDGAGDILERLEGEVACLGGTLREFVQ